MRALVRDALKCDELNYHLREIIGVDDGKSPEEYTDAEIIGEAKYVLESYFIEGAINNDMLTNDFGDRVEEQKLAEKEVRQLKRFIKKYS